jgi:hypothetical protein
MFHAAGTLACWPLDGALSFFERRYCAQGATQRHPLIVVCGPPRSGTTVVFQSLVQSLKVAYFSNLVSLFPKSPLTASRLLGRFTRRSANSPHSYYGRTRGWSGTNDALYLWDRWLGTDRNHPPQAVTPEQSAEMNRFFAAATNLFDLPLVVKNNNLNVTAHLIEESIDEVYFLCLTRNPQDLAESLYRARCDLHGDPSMPYGVDAPRCAADATGVQESEHLSTAKCPPADPVESVCAQVTAMDALARRQQARLSPQRFWLVSYEEFCQAPERLVRRVAEEIFKDPAAVLSQPAPLEVSRRSRVDAAVAERIRQALADSPCPEQGARHSGATEP